MTYKNPVPNIDDETVSEKYCVIFSFSSGVTKEEAHKGINNLIKQHGGEIPISWIKMGYPQFIKKGGIE